MQRLATNWTSIAQPSPQGSGIMLEERLAGWKSQMDTTEQPALTNLEQPRTTTPINSPAWPTVHDQASQQPSMAQQGPPLAGVSYRKGLTPAKLTMLQ